MSLVGSLRTLISTKSSEEPGSGSRNNASGRWSNRLSDGQRTTMNRKLQYSILGADLIWMAVVFFFAIPLHNGQGANLTRWNLPALFVAFSIWTVLYFSKKLEGLRG